MRKVTRALIMGASTATLLAGTLIATSPVAAAAPVAAAPVAAAPVAAVPITTRVAALAVDGNYRVAGVNIRTCASTSCTSLGLGYPGQGARIDCFRQGTTVHGNNLWLHHRNLTTGVVGYSADFYMRHGDLNIPRC
jgi:hypothetical protein